MQVMLIVILMTYLFLVTISAIYGSQRQMITKTNLCLTLLAVLVAATSTIFYVSLNQTLSFYGLVAGLLGISGVALWNGFQRYQKPHLGHHIVRLLVHVVFLVLLYRR